jgi:hypothetical protein
VSRLMPFIRRGTNTHTVYSESEESESSVDLGTSAPNLEDQSHSTGLSQLRVDRSVTSTLSATMEAVFKNVGKFDGTNWEDFCDKFEKACALASKHPKDMLIFHLSDDIFSSVKRQLASLDSWSNSIKPLLSSLFGKVVDQSTVLRNFHSRIQGPAESVQLYLLALRKIEADLSPAMSPEDFLKKFVSGLRAETRRAIKPSQASLSTIGEVLQFVKEYELEFPVIAASAGPSVPAASVNAAAVVKRTKPAQAKKFNGVCFKCEQPGHKWQKCPELIAEMQASSANQERRSRPSGRKPSHLAKVRLTDLAETDDSDDE